MSANDVKLEGMVPAHLKIRAARILMDALEVQADIGFHDFEIGSPQRLSISVEVWLDSPELPEDDDPNRAWNYDFLRTEIQQIAAARRYNLQETLAKAIFDRVAAFRGISALRLRLSKPDVYSDAQGVGVEIASFSGLWP